MEGRERLFYNRPLICLRADKVLLSGIIYADCVDNSDTIPNTLFILEIMYFILNFLSGDAKRASYNKFLS